MKKEDYSAGRKYHCKFEGLPEPSQESIQKSKRLIGRLKMEIKKNTAEKLRRNVLRCSVGQ